MTTTYRRLNMYLTRAGARNRSSPRTLSYKDAERHMRRGPNFSVHIEDMDHGEAVIEHDPHCATRYRVTNLRDTKEVLNDLAWKRAICNAHTIVVRTYA